MNPKTGSRWPAGDGLSVPHPRLGTVRHGARWRALAKAVAVVVVSLVVTVAVVVAVAVMTQQPPTAARG